METAIEKKGSTKGGETGPKKKGWNKWKHSEEQKEFAEKLKESGAETTDVTS